MVGRNPDLGSHRHGPARRTACTRKPWVPATRRTAPEELLLDQAALADVATRAARHLVGTEAAAPVPASVDETPEASSEAARLLDLLLNQPPVGTELRNQLVTDWLHLAEASGRRVPHRLLPALLSLAKTKPAIGEHLHPAIGVRGRWLQDLGRADSAPPSPRIRHWAELAGAEALTEFARLRFSDPATALEELGLHWESLGARERAAHLATLSTKLHSDDEGLLERALDDKAKGVREAATDLLDRLPESARARRMATRLQPLLHSKGFLRKKIDIDLPPAPDASGLRDGIAPDPRAGEPNRLERLHAIIRGAPLDVWTTASGQGPAATLTQLAGEERVVDLIAAIAASRGDLEWVRALLESRKDVRLLGLLPRDERENVLERYLRAGSVQPSLLVPLLGELPRPWGSGLADAVLERVSAKEGSPLAAMLSAVLPMALPQDVAEKCRRLEKSEDAARRRLLSDVVQYQSFRQSLTEAFR
ncbi:DUF5691 domain-containing protein [Arthrobacter terricola]